VAGDLGRGRAAYAAFAWKECHDALTRADESSPLSGEDLELLGVAAYMRGREDEWMHLFERAHKRHLETDHRLRAARCAFWIGMTLALRGELGPATGWLGRAERLVEREGRECAEQGYMLLPVAFQRDTMGDLQGAATTAASAVEIGERFGDPDLVALAAHTAGEFLLKAGNLGEGLALLDRAMVSVTAGEVSPVVSGIVYCGVILACENVYELRRAQEWTVALTRWCERQPDLLAFTGRCLVHRAELMRLRGDWLHALEEARRAGARFEEAMNRAAAAKACYLRGEVHRLRGEFPEAEAAYRETSRLGLEPQPGLALVRLAQGNAEAAAGTLHRTLEQTDEPLQRAALLPAYLEATLAVGQIETARAASTELAEIADTYGTEMLAAMAAQARGAVELAAGDATAAVGALRHAWQAWDELEAPYEAARVRAVLALACRALGDEDGSALELDAARATFEELRAAPDLAELDRLTDARARSGHGLTGRELQVLSLVAAGKSNKQIAVALVISEHTVARHVQNIFTKLGVGSRTAASRYAFEHHLV